jgi:hypothetical protein
VVAKRRRKDENDFMKSPLTTIGIPFLTGGERIGQRQNDK